MWTCKFCGENISDTFDVCWKCDKENDWLNAEATGVDEENGLSFNATDELDGKYKSLKKARNILSLILSISLAYFLLFPSLTPEGAIRKYVFVRGHLISALILEIEHTKGNEPTNKEFQPQGKQFFVRGYVDGVTGMEVMFFYLKKSPLLGWYVESAVTGP